MKSIRKCESEHGSKRDGDWKCTSPTISQVIPTQPAIIRSKLTIETLEQGVKYVQS